MVCLVLEGLGGEPDALPLLAGREFVVVDRILECLSDPPFRHEVTAAPGLFLDHCKAVRVFRGWWSRLARSV